MSDASNASQESNAVNQAPRCPWGCISTLQGETSEFFVEAGCYDGKRYCFEGHLDGYVCPICKRSFFEGLSSQQIHEGCSCRTGACEQGKDCGHYEPIEAVEL